MNAINQVHTKLIASRSYMINRLEKLNVGIRRNDTLAGDNHATQSNMGLFDSLISFIATSKFGKIVTRGIATIDLVLSNVDFIGL